MSMQISAASKTHEAERASFAEDVQYYLSLTPRQLPSRYFYDEVGSALFEAICRLPCYRITRTEQRMLAGLSGEIFARAGRVSTLVELGPGSGQKLATLLSPDSPAGITVHLIDVSSEALESACRALDAHPEVQVVPHHMTYESGLEEVARHARSEGRSLALMLGSNIGNFDPPGADALLRAVRAALLPGDSLLLGADLVKPEHELVQAYDDPLGVTAAFNLNLLARANRELGADFDLARFSHRAIWNAAASRIEMHLVSAERQHVRVPAASLDVMFDAGEIIWTESSYKYQPDGIEAMLNRAEFLVSGQWLDEGFALTLGEAR